MSRTFLQNGITNQYFRLFVADFHCHCIFRVFLVCIFPHSNWILAGKIYRMRENEDQKNSEYGHFLCSVPSAIADYLLLVHMQFQYNRKMLVHFFVLPCTLLKVNKRHNRTMYWNLFKVDNKNTRTMSIMSLWCLYY